MRRSLLIAKVEQFRIDYHCLEIRCSLVNSGGLGWILYNFDVISRPSLASIPRIRRSRNDQTISQAWLNRFGKLHSTRWSGRRRWRLNSIGILSSPESKCYALHSARSYRHGSLSSLRYSVMFAYLLHLIFVRGNPFSVQVVSLYWYHSPYIQLDRSRFGERCSSYLAVCKWSPYIG